MNIKRFYVLVVVVLFSVGTISAQTVDYVMQVEHFNQTRTINTVQDQYYAGAANNNATELKLFAYGSGDPFPGNPGMAIFQTFTDNGNGTTGSARPLTVGDQFQITGYVANNWSFFDNSNAGISFNENTTYSEFNSLTVNQRAKFQINKNGNWFPAASVAGNGYATYGHDAIFTLQLTSSNTAIMVISGNNGTTTTYDLDLANSPSSSTPITSFALWNQTSGGGNDMYWKNGSLTNLGEVRFGGSNSDKTVTGIISDGLKANSTSNVESISFVKEGSGTITLAAANTYTGESYINSGRVKLTNAKGLGDASGGTTVVTGAVIELASDGPYLENLILNGTGVSDGGALIKSNGAIQIYNGNITIGSNARITIENGGNLDFRGIFDFANHTAYFGGNKHFAFGSGSSVLNADKTDGDGAIFKDGLGTLFLRPSLQITGDIVLNKGEIRQNFLSGFPTVGTLIMHEGTVYRSDDTPARKIEKLFSVEGNITLGYTSTSLNPNWGELDFQNTINLTGAERILTCLNNVVFSGELTNGALTKAGPKNLSLSADNSFAGDTRIQTGSLKLDHADALKNSTLNMQAGDAGSLAFGTQTTYRIGGLIGSRNIDMLGKTLEIGNNGSNTTYEGVLSNGSITKIGSGALTLSGNNSYTGNTTLQSGTLALGTGAVDRIANSSMFIFAGGTFSTGGFNETVGKAQLNVNSIIQLGGTSHQLHFAASNAEVWTGDVVLTITGWTGSAGSAGTAGKIFFGNNATGLTSSQLGQIHFAGYTKGAEILSNGEIVPRYYVVTLFDDFDRGGNSDIVGVPSSGGGVDWIETEFPGDVTPIGEYIRIQDNRLEMRNCALTGHIGNKSAAFDVSGLYATTFEEADRTMEWYFNMRQSRLDPSGFGAGDYGIVYILGADNSDFGSNTASGYAVVLGESGDDDPMRLIYFTTGLPGDPKAAIHLPLTIASVNLTGPRNKFYSVKVTFDPCTDKWTLQVREDGTSSFDNPLTISTPPSVGYNSTHINSDLKYMGAYYNHSSGCGESAVFDNIYIPVTTGVAPATYTWVSGAGSFSTPSKWSPSRGCARSTDKLVFNGGTSTVTDVPNQRISQLIIQNGADVTLQNRDLNLTSTLKLIGRDGEDLIIESGSVLTLDVRTNGSNNAIVLSLIEGVTGIIDGTLVMQNTKGAGLPPHRLEAADSDAVQVGGTVTVLKLEGNPFGSSSLTNNNILFKNGSVYNYHSGANPFGLSQPASKVVFESGSRYVHYNSTNSPSLIGRKYADFEVNVTGDLNFILGGNSPWTADSIIITNGHFNISPTTLNIDINCKGNINVLPGKSFTINPTNHSTLSFTGNATQRIYGSGALTFGDNLSMKVDNSAANGVGLILEKDINLNQDFTVENGKVQSNGKTLTMTGINSTILVNDDIEGTNLGVGNNLNLIASGAQTNITGTALARFYNITLDANNTLAVSAGLECMYGSFDVLDNSKLMINAGGYIANSNPASSKSPNYSATSQLIYNTGNDEIDPYGRSIEWTGGTNPGYPGNVIVQNGTHVSTNKSGLVHSLALGVQNDLLIRSGTLDIRDNEATVQIGGDVEVGSQTTSGTLNLSFIENGDLEVKGDFTLNEEGVLHANDRAVIFSGSEHQTITSNTALNEITFGYMRLEKPTGELRLSNDPDGTTVYANGSLGGAVLELSGGDLNLQGQVFNLGGSGGEIKINGTDIENRIVKSATPAEFNVIGEKQVVSQNGTGLIFNDLVTVNISAGMDFGYQITTINATLQINEDGFANLNAPIYGPLGILKYNTGGIYERRVEWSGVEGQPGYPNEVIVTGNTILNPGGDPVNTNTGTAFGARRNVTIESNSAIYMDYGSDDMTVALKVGADLTINGSLSASDVYGGDIHVGGNWVRNAGGVFNPNGRQVLFNGATSQTITAVGGEAFDYLGFSNAGTKDLLDDITVNKNIDFYSGTGALSGSGKTIRLKGDWINNAGQEAFAEAGTTVSFEGSTLQNVNCDVSSFEGFHNLTMNNTGPGIKLNNNASIYGTLKFVDGIIDAKVNRVDFELGSSHDLSGKDSYISGFAKKIGLTSNTEFIFPVGDYRVLAGVSGDSIIDVYQPAALIPNGTSVTDAFTIDYIHANYFPGYTVPNNPPPMDSSLESVSTCNYWNIDQNGSVGAKVRLYWTDACFNITEPASLLVAKVQGGEWVSQGPSTATSGNPAIEGYIETTIALTSFSPFTIGTSGNVNVLPIELLSFTAYPKGQVIETHWITSTEINNEYFTVERSVDAVNFIKVGRVQGAGNSTSELSYSFIDNDPHSGISYYRLKQTDFDGATTYSDIRSVRMDTDKRFELINVYRSEQGVNLTYRSDVEILQVEIFDMLGKRIYTTPIHNIGGVSTIGPSLVRGMYVLRLSNGVEVVSAKFFY